MGRLAPADRPAAAVTARQASGVARRAPRRSRRGALVALAVMACGPATMELHAGGPADWLDFWRQRANALTQNQRQAHSALDEVRAQLKQAELDIGAVVQQMHGNRLRIDALQQRLGKLARQQRREREQLRAQRHAVAMQALSLWRTGSESKLQMLLSQRSFSVLPRMLVYYDYMNRARVTLIERYRESLRQLSSVAEKIAVTEDQLSREQDDLASSQTYLQRYQHTREAQRQALRRAISDRDLEIQHAYRALESMLSTDQRDAWSRPQGPELPFAERVGTLPWPVRGGYVNHFDDETAFSGMTIQAAEGMPVLAVAPGTVSFVRWMSHYGILLVISHDNGYRSVYAHNQGVHFNVGEHVGAGQVIATVGKSGGIDEPALYFEIRRKQQPVDVSRWLQDPAHR